MSSRTPGAGTKVVATRVFWIERWWSYAASGPYTTLRSASC